MTQQQLVARPDLWSLWFGPTGSCHIQSGVTNSHVRPARAAGACAIPPCSPPVPSSDGPVFGRQWWPSNCIGASVRHAPAVLVLPRHAQPGRQGAGCRRRMSRGAVRTRPYPAAAAGQTAGQSSSNSWPNSWPHEAMRPKNPGARAQRPGARASKNRRLAASCGWTGGGWEAGAAAQSDGDPWMGGGIIQYELRSSVYELSCGVLSL